MAGGISAVPRVRGGAPRQDPEEASRGDRCRGAAGCPGRAADGTAAAGRSPDRAGVRGLRVGQGRPRLHGHVPRHAELQPRGDAATPRPGRLAVSVRRCWRSSASSHRARRTRSSSRSMERPRRRSTWTPRPAGSVPAPTRRTRRSSLRVGSRGPAGSMSATCDWAPCSCRQSVAEGRHGPRSGSTGRPGSPCRNRPRGRVSAVFEAMPRRRTTVPYTRDRP